MLHGAKLTFELELHMIHLRRLISRAAVSRYEFELYHVYAWIFGWLVLTRTSAKWTFSSVQELDQEGSDIKEKNQDEADDSDSESEMEEEDPEEFDEEVPGDDGNNDGAEDVVQTISRTSLFPRQLLVAQPSPKGIPKVEAVPDPEVKTETTVGLEPDSQKDHHRIPDFITFATNQHGNMFVLFLHEIKPAPHSLVQANREDFTSDKEYLMKLKSYYSDAFDKLFNQVLEQVQLAFDKFKTQDVLHAIPFVGLK